jgi:hypothetical protein
MPPKKTRKNKHKHGHKHEHKHANKSKHNHNDRRFYRTPTPYPISPMQNISGIVSSSSAAMKAVSHDKKHWHVDTNINGVKKHANLTNSQIMDILAYPAAKQDLRTQLIQKLRDMSPRPMYDERRPIFIAPNLGAPIIRMYEPREPHQHQKIEYIYKNGCSNKPIMLDKLSPLHEARIIPEMNGEPIHLIPNPVQSYNDSGLSSIRKAKKKGKGKGGGKTVNKKGKR